MKIKNDLILFMVTTSLAIFILVLFGPEYFATFILGVLLGFMLGASTTIEKMIG